MNTVPAIIHGAEQRPMPVDLRMAAGANHTPVIVFVHGFKGFKDWGHWPLMGEAFARRGFAFVSFNFALGGTTPQSPTDHADPEAFARNNFTHEQDDLGKVIDALTDGTLFPDASLDRSGFFLLGHSRGGAAVIVKAAEDARVKGLATLCALGDMGRTAQDRTEWQRTGVTHVANSRTGQQLPMYFQIVEDYERNRHRFDLLQCCQRITVPALFIHGTADATVPASDARRLHAACPASELLLIEGGDHVLGGRHPWTSDTLPDDTLRALEGVVGVFAKR
ncbi:MAG: prolyl oligopeptidase family serine peptidase [Flavobacteriales bacterium]|nr:prolyl oligopeptidase family serine peptidase [Flavobacteriales bacterium]